MPDAPIRSPILRFDKTLGEKRLKDIRSNCSALVLHDNNLWIGGDEGTAVDRLTRDDAGNFGRHTRFDLLPLLGLAAGEKTEIDVEGLDVHGGYLWVIGSHSLKRRKADAGKTAAENIARLADVTPDPNRFTLGRVPLRKRGADFEPVPRDGTLTAARLEGDDRGNLLTDALARDPHIGPFVPRLSKGGTLVGTPSKDNGLDVEGLAVSGTRVFLGLRGPVLRGWAVVIELHAAESGPGVLGLEALGGTTYRKHFLQLGGLGVRDLAIHGQDLYVLAGPTMDLDGPVFIYRWVDALEQASDTLVFEKDLKRPVSLPFGIGDDHAEGMTVIADPLSAMVCYDSPVDARIDGVDRDGVKTDVFLL